MNAPAPAPARRGNGSRYLFMALLGLVVGVVASIMVMRAIQQRHDPYPEAVMQVMSAHMRALKQNVVQNRCAATDTLPHLQSLRVLANDIEPAFADMRDDSKFLRYAGDLRGAIDAALASPPMACAGVQAAAADIGEACESCHRHARQ
ncbi:MAG TPA: hypothetical protein VIG88_01155 [Lysobacter sp.]